MELLAMNVFDFLSDPGRIAVMIPIVAIVTGGVTFIVKSVIDHRERMAMIEMGIHPDHPPEQPVTESQYPDTRPTARV